MPANNGASQTASLRLPRREEVSCGRYLRRLQDEAGKTILHEIAHAQTMIIVGNTEDMHGSTWLAQCGRIMPAAMFWREVMTYGNESR